MTIGLTLKNQGFAWSHPLVAGLLLASVAILALFFWAEARAINPLLPLSLLNRSQVLLLLLANAPLTAMWFARVSPASSEEAYIVLIVGILPADLPTDCAGHGFATDRFDYSSVYSCRRIDISLRGLAHESEPFESHKVSANGLQYFKEYKWLQVVAPAFSWVQALSLMHTWGTDTNATRLWVELAAAGVGAIPYTSLTSELPLLSPVLFHAEGFSRTDCRGRARRDRTRRIRNLRLPRHRPDMGNSRRVRHPAGGVGLLFAWRPSGSLRHTHIPHYQQPSNMFARTGYPD